MCFIVHSPHATVYIDYHHTLIGMPMGHVLFVVVQQVSKVGCVRVLDGEFIHIDDPASCYAEKGQTDLQSKAAGITLVTASLCFCLRVIRHFAPPLTQFADLEASWPSKDHLPS